MQIHHFYDFCFQHVNISQSIYFWAGSPVNFFFHACPHCSYYHTRYQHTLLREFQAPSPIIKGTLGKVTENILKILKICHNLSKLILGNPATWLLKVRYNLNIRIINVFLKTSKLIFFCNVKCKGYIFIFMSEHMFLLL